VSKSPVTNSAPASANARAAAVAGARGVFLVPPAAFGPNGWNAELEATRGLAVIDAAKRASVDQIVFTGVASMTDDAAWGQAGKGSIEAATAASGLRYTLLRPVRFMENYVLRGSPVDGIVDGVQKHLFPADKPVQMIAIDDIAAFAALAFADPDRFHGRTLELAGDALTPVAALAAITRATGYPVRYHEVTEAEADALGEQIGNTWRLLHESGGGWHADIPALREIYPALNTLESWLGTTGAAQIKAQQDRDRLAAAH
jgi:uncharacterized protein YbjT (DUF2867 family)